jgi:hypothetical protein
MKHLTQSLLIVVLFCGVQTLAASKKQTASPVVEGVELQTASGRSERFVPAESSQSGVVGSASDKAGQVFYRHGVVSEGSKYVTTGRVIVAFETAEDYEAFAAAHGLEFVKEINSRKPTALFRNASGRNDVITASTLGALPGVRYATPDWVAPVGLR